MKESIIKGFPAYKIREDGKVFSKYKPKTGIIWDYYSEITPTVDTTGYLVVTLQDKKSGKRKFSVHRLLGVSFLPNPYDLPCINHIDGCKLNNSLSNLEWCTPSHNSQHAVDMGLTEPAYEVTRKKVRQKDLEGNTIKDFISCSEASKATGVTRQNICKVAAGGRRQAGGYRWEYI